MCMHVCMCVLETWVQLSEETRIEHQIKTGGSAQTDVRAASKLRNLCKSKKQFKPLTHAQTQGGVNIIIPI